MFDILIVCKQMTEDELNCKGYIAILGRLRNCLDAQIVCDKDGFVDWCIVRLEMPLTRFEECWPLPLKPQHSNPNPNTLANQL